METIQFAVRSTKYPLSEVAEAIQNVLAEHSEDLELERMAKELFTISMEIKHPLLLRKR